jgi:CubicO group peptidase (beta-lactamase class C family)
MVTHDTQIQAALALVDAYLGAERAARGWAGLSAAVVLDQEIIWSNGYGYTNIERQIAATPRSRYSIASITKLFTVTMLMQLRDAGALHLDDPVAAYDPAFAIRSAFPTTRPITFRQLASHTAGLQKDFPFPYWDTQVIPPIDELLATLPAMAPVFPPMTLFKYSNVGMACLGHALARIAGQPYTDYVMERIVRPLGMGGTTFTITEAMEPELALGYTPVVRGETPERAPYFPDYDIGGLAATGGLYSSVEEIARFIALQFRDGPPGGGQILDGATLREMHAPVMLRDGWERAIGLGWWLARVAGETSIGHPGDHSGFNAEIRLIPAQKLGIALFINSNGDLGAVTTKALEMLAPVVRHSAAHATAMTTPPAPAAWRRYTGQYGSFEVAIVDGKLIGRSWETPGEVVTFEPVAEHLFRMRGGFLTGENVRFEVDESGRVARIRYNGFARERTVDR